MGHGQSRKPSADRRGPFARKSHDETCDMLALLKTADFMPFIDELKRRAQLIATDTGDLEAPLVLTGSLGDDASNFIYLRCNCPGRYIGVDVNSTDIRGQTALHSAVRRRCIDAVEILLCNGSVAYCDYHNACGMTALHTACEVGSVRIVQMLLDVGADPDATETGRGAAEARTPLTIAAAHGRDGCIAALSRAGADVNGRDGTGSTPLHRAALHGHTACVRELLDAGAEPDALDGFGATCMQLTLARRRGHVSPTNDILRMLLDRSCDLEVGSARLPPVLLLAAVAGEMDVLKACLASGVSPDVQDIGTARSSLYYIFTGDLSRLYDHYGSNNSTTPKIKSPSLSPWSGALLEVALAPPRRRREVFSCLMLYGSDVQVVLAEAITADAVTVRRYVSLPYHSDLLCVAIAACGRLPALHVPVFLWAVIGASGDRVARALLAATPSLDDTIRARLYNSRDWTGERNETAELAALEDAGLALDTAVWMRTLVRSPRSLRDWCRFTIRRHITGNVTYQLDRLPLPARMRSYIAFDCNLENQ